MVKPLQSLRDVNWDSACVLLLLLLNVIILFFMALSKLRQRNSYSWSQWPCQLFQAHWQDWASFRTFLTKAEHSAELLHHFCPMCAQVQEGGRLQLSTNHISVGGEDTPRKELLVWLISPPKYGFIENTGRGELQTNCGRIIWASDISSRKRMKGKHHQFKEASNDKLNGKTNI